MPLRPVTDLSSAVPLAPVDQVLGHPRAVVVDLRSPSEFAEDHLPGAHNVPLFDDAGRALIGLLYNQASPERAFEEGRRLVLDRVHDLVEEVARLASWEVPEGRSLAEDVGEICKGGITRMEQQLAGEPLVGLPERPLVLHCWRGGLRSRSVVHLMRRLGLAQAVGLQGGYKAYRGTVRERLGELELPRPFVLRGWTGVGKTLVLREIEEQRPGSTLDLEGLAGHRSSLLGMVGLEPCSQKAFDSRLATALYGRDVGHPLVVEGESRKVGDVTCPPRVWEALDGGINIRLTASRERRIQVLMEDYLARPEALPLLREQLAVVAERMGRPGEGLLAHFDGARWSELVGRLLDDYYDPLYEHSERGRSYALEVVADDPVDAARRVLDWIESAP